MTTETPIFRSPDLPIDPPDSRAPKEPFTTITSRTLGTWFQSIDEAKTYAKHIAAELDLEPDAVISGEASATETKHEKYYTAYIEIETNHDEEEIDEAMIIMLSYLYAHSRR